jgi:hypothetical protein
MAEIRASRKSACGGGIGSLQVEFRDKVIGWIKLDDNSQLADRALPRFDLRYRNETDWQSLTIREQHADPDRGWRKTSERKLLKLLEAAGYIDTQKGTMTDRKGGARVCKPRVGIFWLLNGQLLLAGTPISDAEPYGNNLGHPEGHHSVWERWQKLGSVPKDIPYEEPPRGRVIFNKIDGTFLLLADRCILKRKSIVGKIRRALDLPDTVTVDTDKHYRCHTCLYGSDTDEDWDD